MMQTYRVTWEIDVDATDPGEAAEMAYEIMRKERSTANVFDVIDQSGDTTRVDVQEVLEGRA